MVYLLSLLVAYVVGTFPTAYLMVKVVQRTDLRRAGSTNIGALNAYEVTGSRWIGVSVALLDMLKGALAVWASYGIGMRYADIFDPFLFKSLGLIGVVAGHNYNIWLSLGAGKLSGGKGLAAAAGGLLFTMPFLIPLWVIAHYTGRWLFRLWRGINDVIPGNVIATSLFPVFAWLLYGPRAAYIGLILAALVLPKHVHQMQELFRSAPVEGKASD